MPQPPTPIQLDSFVLQQRLEVSRELCGRRLSHFVQQAWPTVETRPLVWGWHLDAICEHLEAVTAGQIRNLVICVPPRHTKSTTVSVMWPAWTWIDVPKKQLLRGPHIKWLFCSYAADLSIEHSVACRRLIDSNWYRRRWGKSFQFTLDQNQKAQFENTKRGIRRAVGIGGGSTGKGGDIQVIDDPHNVREAESDVIRQGVIEWHDRVWFTRMDDPKHSPQITICQRVSELDLVAHLIELGGYEMLSLPTEYEGSKYVTSIGWEDPRKKEGELLCPERFGSKEIERAKFVLGSYAYAAQHQQRPAPIEGGILKTYWWRYWQPAGADLPPVEVRGPDGGVLQIPAVELPVAFDEQFQSWDMAFKDTKASAYVCGQVWAQLLANYYLLGQARGKWDFVRTLVEVQNLTLRWPDAIAKLIEDKANGPAVMSALKNKVSGMIPVEPYGSKESRAFAVSPVIESGNVYLPHPALAAWVESFIGEHGMFPNGRYKDQVDCTTQALSRNQDRTTLDIASIYSETQAGLYAEVA